MPAAAAAKAVATAETPAAADAVLPATKRPRTEAELSAASSSVGVGASQMPALPGAEEEASTIDSRRVMQTVIPYVKAHMCDYLRRKNLLTEEESSFEQMKPLRIESEVGKSMTSYKPPWDPAQCVTSLKESGCYEASGNLGWMNPEVATDKTTMPSEPVSWAWLLDYSRTGFRTTISEGGDSRKRIKFIFPMHGNVDKKFGESEYPAGIVPMGAHGHIWAWYLSVMEALRSDDHERVLLLLECALTTTIHLTAQCSQAKLLLDSMLYSEVVREATKVMVDNFVTFTRKVMAMPRKLTVQDFAKDGIRFNGSLVNVTMIRTVQALHPLLNDEVMGLFLELSKRYGQDLVSGSYGKLRLLVMGVKGSGDVEDVGVLLVWALEALLVQLLREEAKASDFTQDTFSKSKDGTPSWIQMSLGQRLCMQQLLNIVRSLQSQDAALADQIEKQAIAPLASPKLYHKVFPVSSPSAETEILDEDTPEEKASIDFIAKISQSLPRAGVLCGEFMKKLYEGGYDETIEKLLKENILETSLKTLDYEAMGDMGKSMQEIIKVAHLASDVTGTSAGPPKASLRELVRRHSESGDHDHEAARMERADVWKRAVTHRKKLITLGTIKDHKKMQNYVEAFRKSGAAKAFKGVIKESHRLFTMSADLMNQTEKQPWLVQSQPDAKHFTACVDFLKAQRDPGDMIAGFDGCCGSKVRRDLEDALNELPSTVEIFLVFDRSWNEWCAGRKCHLTSRNTEVGYVTCPTNRSRMKVQSRESAGEDTSHFTSYTGLTLPPRSSLALINKDDKDTIFPTKELDNVPEKWLKTSAGVLLFWGETKSKDFWINFIKEHLVKCIVDVTPGAGTLAIACMETDTVYFGICAHQQHAAWLSNVIDRAALKTITTAGTVLYQEDLATHIQELFADALEEPDGEVNDDHLQCSDTEDA